MAVDPECPACTKVREGRMLKVQSIVNPSACEGCACGCRCHELWAEALERFSQ